MNIDDVNRGITRNKKRHRIGRGPGSGWGKTAGRGHKGQKSRAGFSRHPIFQGGAMPLVRRVPKRGFNNRFALIVGTVNVDDLERAFEAGEEVTPETLQAKSLAKTRWDVLKILGDGELTKKLTVSRTSVQRVGQGKNREGGWGGGRPAWQSLRAAKTEAETKGIVQDLGLMVRQATVPPALVAEQVAVVILDTSEDGSASCGKNFALSSRYPSCDRRSS